MTGIGGNRTAVIQVMDTARNAIGEQEPRWKDAMTLTGWLDLASGGTEDTGYSTFSAKIQQSSHVFVADYAPVPREVYAENCRVVIDGMVYDLMLLDDPMELHAQLELYMKFTGGQAHG